MSEVIFQFRTLSIITATFHPLYYTNCFPLPYTITHTHVGRITWTIAGKLAPPRRELYTETVTNAISK